MDINQFCNMFLDEVICRRYLENVIWPFGRFCPHYGCLKSWRIKGESSRSGLYECAGFSGQFTVTTKTPMHSTKLSLQIWLIAMCLIIRSSKGIFSVGLARWLGVYQKTVWKVVHAIRAIMDVHTDTVGMLTGIVELDEKYLGGKPRFQHGVSIPRAEEPRRPGGTW
ncbi:IS1595 family transposase [Malonomonas rubra]|uniref:IS1595 family transposase n=1 Tax=Malonomonas rubra TaxID=57040 RepID=UPI0026E9AAA4|nr:IS1595 family transposase [Malonomonas rubra]